MYHRKYGFESFSDVVKDRRSLAKFMAEIPSDISDSDIGGFSVYGDDIICDYNVTSSVIHDLSEMGFVVNNDKSFTGSNAFRESCGKYYYNGADITPLRFQVPSSSRVWAEDTAVSIVDLINRCGDYRYLNLHSYLINLALHHPIQGVRRQKWNGKWVNPLLFSEDRATSFAIYHPAPRNLALRKRWNDDLQRDEVQSCGVSVRTRKHPSFTIPLTIEGNVEVSAESAAFERYRYGLWWRAAYLRNEFDPSSEGIPKCDSFGTRLRGRWTTTWQ
jgi:hypothetical protein